jgi:hypothetical protein
LSFATKPDSKITCRKSFALSSSRSRGGPTTSAPICASARVAMLPSIVVAAWLVSSWKKTSFRQPQENRNSGVSAMDMPKAVLPKMRDGVHANKTCR